MTFGILAQGMGRGLMPLVLNQLLESRQVEQFVSLGLCKLS